MIEAALKEIASYRRPLRIMEVCGTHTSVIAKSGIRSLLPENIELVSGPGCPVCVTPGAYIDALIQLAQQLDTAVLSFGDMLRVPGTSGSLLDAKARGADVRLIYSPLEAIPIAQTDPQKTFIAAAVGFETTAPAFALLAQQAKELNIRNLRFLTSLKTMIPAMEYICRSDNEIDAFLCPGNVSVIIGSEAYAPLAREFQKPFVVAGFTGEHVVAAVYEIIRQIKSREFSAANLYKPHVRPQGNEQALAAMAECFCTSDAMWRGIGMIHGSGLVLNHDYAWLSAGDIPNETDDLPPGCGCAAVMLGKLRPTGCMLFGSRCTPQTPVGPCMVSAEGACGIHYSIYGRSVK